MGDEFRSSQPADRTQKSRDCFSRYDAGGATQYSAQDVSQLGPRARRMDPSARAQPRQRRARRDLRGQGELGRGRTPLQRSRLVRVDRALRKFRADADCAIDLRLPPRHRASRAAQPAHRRRHLYPARPLRQPHHRAQGGRARDDADAAAELDDRHCTRSRRAQGRVRRIFSGCRHRPATASRGCRSRPVRR